MSVQDRTPVTYRGQSSAKVLLSGRPACLYRFYDSDGLLLYIGITIYGPTRWTQHATYQDWWPAVARVEVEHFPTVTEAHTAEVAAILAERPRYNVMHTEPPKDAPPRQNRRHGSGSVFFNQRIGRWVAQVSLGWQGRGKRPLRSFDTREEAEAALPGLLELRDSLR
jgi:hypothetical protein